MHAEEVVTSNFIEDDNIGIYGDRLQIVTLNRVVEFLKSDSQSKNIALDFKFLEACQPNLNKILIELKTAGYKIIFLNIKKSLCDELAITTIANSKNLLEGDTYSKYYFFEDANDPLTETEIAVHILFQETFKVKIKKFIEPHQQPHTSSNVYLTSYVDVKKFLSYEKEFMLFSLYKLALKIKKEWHVEIDKDPVLICQSMNSAYIVSVLSNLLKLDILILDKIGPINKLYNRLDKTIIANRKYIVVSDLVCLGTEVKIVKNIIQFIGGRFLGNVSIIKTETLSKADILRRDASIAVFSINKNNNKELGYSITTDLEQL
ncbi:hypothetical protein [Mucilaginibacter ginkgonis]|uniref:Uncharacterized protein n=1 Tax=Mucilaginibacter ginkgonis TaxID=2682091 RepID=A0A6I4HVH5_9SPHI|nr:hypothetical protein [Mucilaginibacter ginkgonis]QQL49901.1 hypothetical protein GO620_000170 [Mucilaginibacter ginkgonis]